MNIPYMEVGVPQGPDEHDRSVRLVLQMFQEVFSMLIRCTLIPCADTVDTGEPNSVRLQATHNEQ